jgi:cell wall assembly regulator SMI1
LKELWERLENWLIRHYPILLDSLNNGATDEMINEAEVRMGIKLPTDFKDSLKIHNGQKGVSFEYPGLIGGYQLLSLDSIIDEWEVWTNLLNEGVFDETDELEFNNNKVKTDQWWRAKWVPITSDGGGNHHCIDLDPSLEGISGQVIEMWHDDEIRALIGDSFKECFKIIVENLENGSYFLEENNGDLEFNFWGFNRELT